MKRLICSILFIFYLTGCVSFNKLVSERKYDQAEQFCAKIKKSKEKSDCYHCLADTLLAVKKYEQALQCYEKAGLAKEGAKKIALSLMEDKLFYDAYRYFEKADMAYEGAEQIALCLLKDKSFDKAYQYFDKAGMARKGAEKIALTLLENKSYNEAYKYFELAGMANEGAVKIISNLAAEKSYAKALAFFELSGNSEKAANEIGDILFNMEYFKSAAYYYQFAKQTNSLAQCAQKISAGLAQWQDGSTIADAIPEKLGFNLSDQLVVCNAENGGIEIKNLYSGKSVTLGKEENIVFKNLQLFYQDLMLLYTKDDRLFVMNILDGQFQNIPTGHTQPVSAIASNVATQSLLTGSWDNTIKYWGTKALEPSATLTGHTAGITWLDFAGAGNIAASGSWDHTARIWDVQAAKEKFCCEHNSPVNQVALSPDGKYMITCEKDNIIKVWNTASGRLFKTLKGHAAVVNAIAISPDNQTLLSGDFDGIVNKWSLPSGTLIKSLQAHSSAVTSIRIAPNAAYYVTSGMDFNVKFWWLADKKLFLSNYAL